MAMSYGNVYVAQVAMGASQTQLIQALTEAESYPGTSLVIAYAPCINHGILRGMNAAQEEMKRAVQAGYWHLYRYNPLLKAAGENPFKLDSKAPDGSFKDFLLGEGRFASLFRSFPSAAEELLRESEAEAAEKYQSYLQLAQPQAKV
jgi:pyruvate-ferredoxin/flavodoxin oxidoreductase